MKRLLTTICALVLLAAVFWAVRAPRLPMTEWQPQAQPIAMRVQTFEAAAAYAKTAAPSIAAMVVDAAGRVYLASGDGHVGMLSSNLSGFSELGETEGNPRGLAFGPRGGVVVADAKLGLLSVGAGESVLVGRGPNLRFASAVDGAALDKNLYFTDRSSRFGRHSIKRAMIADDASGRLLQHNVDTHETRVLLEGLHLPDGVAVGPDDAYVLVAESGRRRVLRYWLKGPSAGQHDIFVDHLPGVPGALTFNNHGRFWLVLAPVPTQLDALLAGHSMARELAFRMPWLLRDAVTAPQVLALDTAGEVQANLKADSVLALPSISAVQEKGAWLYVASAGRAGLTRLALQDFLAEAPKAPNLASPSEPTALGQVLSEEEREEQEREQRERDSR